MALKFEPHVLYPNQRPYPDQRLRCTPITARTLISAYTAPLSVPALHPDQRLRCTPISARTPISAYTAPRSVPALHPDQRPHCARTAPVPRLAPNSTPISAHYPPNSAGAIGRLLIHQPWQGFVRMLSVCDSKAAYALGMAMLYTVAQLQ